MAELTRVTISLEENLLEAFDKLIASKGYATRSEAIRDLIRDLLIRQEARSHDGEQVAVVTMVYDHHARELAAKLIDKQHHHHDLVVSTLHVEELLSTKGVLLGDITYTSGERALDKLR
jgi:CopG family transcriptional regulator, nickel-responsive regulator